MRPQENGYHSDLNQVSFFKQQDQEIQFTDEPQLEIGVQYYDIADYHGSDYEVRTKNQPQKNKKPCKY
ncbi:hypothetical protein [uncultured Paraglaciecola sp.]|uniref:hypothetical protein n=1 Tax=uncultured Paraglaciecola sp. TaxID=1765024 RepID=UPI00262DB679|nr:hypothetical protein [uncultured Paraglaciecola sp.]